MDTLKLTKEHYQKLGSEKMASLMNKKRHSANLRLIKQHIPKNKKILDLACGYGRLTIPLAKAGYEIDGIDLAPNFIKDAKKNAKKENVKIKFKIGNMCDLPYKDDSFDAIICMWSSFNHLLKKLEQKQSLNEMYRILKPNGLGIIDLPYFGKQKKNIRKDIINGVPITSFVHDEDSILNAIKKSKFNKYKIKKEIIGERKRLIAYLIR
jgi:ubiquinone/menaquinone biosynthesis C-methylase UbiE|tara:strand:- start:73 stop:699 length:627 start_codon:yes stop_codon:yes gene_type:complete